MPVYAYRCGHCGVQFERVQRFSDNPIAVCPECDTAAVRRIIQPAGIIFKGSGWYVNDSKASNPAGKPSKDKSGDGSSSSSEKSGSSGDTNTSATEKSGSPSNNDSSSGEKSRPSGETASTASEN